MKGRGLILTLVAALAAIAVTAQSPAEMQRRRDALREVSLRADSGDAEALYQLSLLHERGYDSIPRDSAMALNLLRCAADAGYAPAENLLGFKLISGEGGAERNPAEGLERIQHAAELGDPKALSNIGFLLLHGEGVEHDAEKAAYWLQRASERRILSATSMLGDLYRDGIGVAQDSMKADSLYRMAFDNGLTDAGYKLYELTRATIEALPADTLLREALYYYNRTTPSIGVKIISRLADSIPEGTHGVTPALRAHAKALMGDAYSRGRGIRYDYDLSTRCYLEAALAGDPSAQFIIGEMLEIFP
ncbi:MAG: sel1 repeat family protein, partial [Muribaculaceae bacterium]|nr:sel1 repeat family protein [Muribaculaceae bacterium]